MARTLIAILLMLLVWSASASAQTKSTTKRSPSKAAPRDAKEKEAEKARADLREMLDLLHESVLVLRYKAPLTAELLSVSRMAAGKTSERKSDTASIYVDDEIGIGWIVSTQQLSFVLENRTNQTARLVWDNAVLVDPDGKNHRVIHSGVKMIDADKPQPPSTILGGTKLEDMVFPADMLEFTEGSWKREPLFDWLDVGKKLLVLLPFDVAGQTREYTFAFRVRAANPEALRDREREEIIDKVGEAATLEQIVTVLKRQPDHREDRDTSFGKLTRVTYETERLIFNLLDGKLDSISMNER